MIPETEVARRQFVLAANGLSFGYGVRSVLAGVGLEVGPGEVLVLLGPNGAGKSTLLRLLAGLLRPQSGQVWWWGRSPRDAGTPWQRVGVIGHGSYLFDDLTAQENLAYYARLLRLTDPETRARAALAEAGLGAVAGRLIGECSRGTVQRVSLCRAWLGDPLLVLADEPAAGLDPDAGRTLHRRLEALRDAGGAAVLISHDLAGAFRMAQRYAVLAGGRIVDSGLTADWSGRAEAFDVAYGQAVAKGRRAARAGRAPQVREVASPMAWGPSAARVPLTTGVAAVLARQWRLWLRSSDLLGNVLAFGLLVALVFGLALDPAAVSLRPVFAGLLWVGLIFAGLPAVFRAFATEWEHDAAEGFATTGAEPVALFYGVCLGSLVGFMLAEAALVPAFVALLQVAVAPGRLAVLAGALALAAAGFVPAASLVAAVLSRAFRGRGGGLLPLLALPLLVPVILGAVQLIGGAVYPTGSPPSAPWWLLLAAYALVAWTLPYALFPVVAEG